MPGERTPRNVPMIPLADIVALSTSVSNHWSSMSAALMVMSWSRLCWFDAREPAEALAEVEEAREAGQVEGIGIGRDHGQDGLDELRHVHHGLRVLVVGLGVGGGVPVDLPPRPRVVAHPPEVVPVRHGREGAVEGKDLQAVAGEVQLADDLRPEERDHVGADGELEAGEDLLRDRGSPEHVPALEDEHLLARPGQVGGAHQAVVPAADDDRVVGTSAHERAAFYPGLAKHGNADLLRMKNRGADSWIVI